MSQTETAPSDVTAANWRTPPFSRWAFHNVSQVVPVAGIAASTTPLELPSAPVAFDEFKLPSLSGSTLDLAGFLEATASDGLVILRDGEVVLETYANGLTDGTPHILMSASKAITGLLAGILQRNGALDLEALASRYVPEVEATGYRGATVRNLIDMRAGVVLDDAARAGYDAAVGSDPAAPGFHGLIEATTAARDAHGGNFSYISLNTDLVGWVMERATGKAFADLVSELLWKPADAETDGYIVTDREGAAWPSGGVCATVRDLARIGDLLVNDGLRGGVEVIPKAWIDDLAGAGDRAAWRDGEWGQSFSFISPNMSYRAGWYAVHDAPSHLFAMGVHGQNLFVDRANRIVIAKLSSQGARIDPAAMWLTHKAVPELTRIALRA